MVLKAVCEIHVSAKFSSFIMLWSRELFGKWRHNWEAKGNAHKVTMHGFGTEVSRNLAIWLAESRDYHLFIYKVYQYTLSMFVPILTSFGI